MSFKEYQRLVNKVLLTESNNVVSDQKKSLMNSTKQCNSFFKNKEGSSSKVDSKTLVSKLTWEYWLKSCKNT